MCGATSHLLPNIPMQWGAGEHLEIGTLKMIKMKTHGSQGLVDQNEREKAKVLPQKSHFLKEMFFEGVPALLTITNEGHK